MAATLYQTTVERVDVLSFNVKSFRLKFTEAIPLEFQAGQFVIVNVPKDGLVVKRAYSIASPPHDKGAIELCIQHVEKGIASTFFWKLKEGMAIDLSGPHGKFLLKEPMDSYEPIFMATGTGVAPLRSMIHDLVQRRAIKDIWLFFGCRYENSMLYDSEFRSLAAMRRNFHYIPTISRPKEWHGEVGHVQQTFQKHIKEFANKEIYICGWLEMVKAVNQDLITMGVPKEQIHYEEWA